MNDNAVKECPYCRETIAAEAVKCRYCKTLLIETGSLKAECRRDLPGRMIAGVSVYLARVFGVSSAAVRIGFVLLTLFTGPVGPVLYLAVWLLTPFTPGAQTPAEQMLESLRGALDGLSARHAESTAAPAPPQPAQAAPAPSTAE